MSDAGLLLIIIATAVGLFVWGRFPVMLVALSVCVSLWFAGLVTLEQAFAGFGDSVILFIAGLFIVAAGLETTGVTARLAAALDDMGHNEDADRVIFEKERLQRRARRLRARSRAASRSSAAISASRRPRPIPPSTR